MKRTILALLGLSLAGTLASQNAPPVDARIGELPRGAGYRITGTVVSMVGNSFILDDGTGQVIVDAGPRWWRVLNVREGETVTVVGEPGPYEFDVFSVTLGDGTTVQIRPAFGGPPPWAGGPYAAPLPPGPPAPPPPGGPPPPPSGAPPPPLPPG